MQEAKPSHYRKFGFEVWDMMEQVFGDVLFYAHLQQAALEYQMRIGHKEGQAESDMAKIKVLLAKLKQLEIKNPGVKEQVEELMGKSN